MTLSPEAKELNVILQKQNPFLYRVLSRKGRSSFFPTKGIIAHSREAKGKKINATAGIALDDDQTLLHLSSLQRGIGYLPEETSSYAPSHGLPALRNSWKRKQGSRFLTSLPLVTCGLTHALSLAGFLFVNPGDEVILPSLYWDNYDLIFSQRHGALIKTYPLFAGSKLNLSGFRDAVLHSSDSASEITQEQKKKKIIVINFPHNPTGYSPSEEEAAQIVNVLKEAAEAGMDLVVICDDAYAGFVFQQGIAVQSLFHQLGNCHENVLTVKADGASKELYAWGLRVAFITFACKNSSPEVLKVIEEKTAGAIRSSISSCSTLSQNLIIKALLEKKNEKEQQEEQHHKNIIQQRHDLVVAALSNNRYQEFFKPLPFNSGYFFCLELRCDAEPVRKLLLEKYDTGVIAIKNYLRIAYSSVSTKDIPELIENIHLACKEVEMGKN